MELIERLQAAQGPDRELDGEIWLCADPAMVPFWPHWTAEQRENMTPHYTASLDAAMTLVPKGWRWDSLERDVSWIEHQSTEQSFGVGIDQRDGDGRWIRNEVGAHDLLPLALCIAALKARAA